MQAGHTCLIAFVQDADACALCTCNVCECACIGVVTHCVCVFMSASACVCTINICLLGPDLLYMLKFLPLMLLSIAQKVFHYAQKSARIISRISANFFE